MKLKKGCNKKKKIKEKYQCKKKVKHIFSENMKSFQSTINKISKHTENKNGSNLTNVTPIPFCYK